MHTLETNLDFYNSSVKNSVSQTNKTLKKGIQILTVNIYCSYIYILQAISTNPIKWTRRIEFAITELVTVEIIISYYKFSDIFHQAEL